MDGIGRLFQAPDPQQRGRSFQLKLSAVAAERQLTRQLTVGASGMHGEGFGSGQSRLKGEIDQRQVYLSTLITLSLRRSATGIPEGLLPVGLSRVSEGIEGLNL